MKRIINLVLALFVVIGLISVGFNASAVTTVKQFKPHDVTQTWYKAGGTLDNQWPQSTDKITCGGIKQVDTYTIDTADLEQQYAALISGGVLNSPSDDAAFHPHNYSVSVLPACVVTITVPELTVIPPTCELDGGIPFLQNPPAQNANGYEFPGQGYRVYLSPAFAGPGTYTATIQKIGAGFDSAFPGGTKVVGNTSQTLIVLPKLGTQTTDSKAPCYVAPKPDNKVVTTYTEWTGPAPTCDILTQTWTRGVTVTTTEFIFVNQVWVEGPVTVTHPIDETKTVSYSGPSCAPNTICPSDLIYKDGDCVDQNVPAPSVSNTPKPKPVVKVLVKATPSPIVAKKVVPVTVVPVAETNTLASTGANPNPGLKWGIVAVLLGTGLVLTSRLTRDRHKNK